MGGRDDYPIITFARILKYRAIPLPELIGKLLELGRRGMGGPVEIEFAVNLPADRSDRPEFVLLQIRPMSTGRGRQEVSIQAQEIERAICHSTQALGNGETTTIADIVYVRPATFDPSRTVDIAAQVGALNGRLAAEKRPYLLVGPGRWGSADHWLGIPVEWHQISAVGAIVETTLSSLRADPSQGSHFFHNITSLGIGYITVADARYGRIAWDWLEAHPAATETAFLRHLRLERPLTIKIDGQSQEAVILAG
jgi:hypothetical protein